MSDETAKHEFVGNRVMERLSGFIQGIGMTGQDARQIVNRVVAGDRSAPEYDIAAKARLDADCVGLAMSDDADLVLEAVAMLGAAGVAVAPIGNELDRWQVRDLTFSDAGLWRLALRRGLVGNGESRWPGAMPKAPSPRGARPRLDVRLRVLAALTPEPSTATEIAERAGLPGREQAMHAARALVRLEADGFAMRSGTQQAPRSRSAVAAPASTGQGQENVA